MAISLAAEDHLSRRACPRGAAAERGAGPDGQHHPPDLGSGVWGPCRIRHEQRYAGPAVLTATIYVIVDLELPRAGLIRIDAADQLLVDVREWMR